MVLPCGLAQLFYLLAIFSIPSLPSFSWSTGSGLGAVLFDCTFLTCVLPRPSSRTGKCVLISRCEKTVWFLCQYCQEIVHNQVIGYHYIQELIFSSAHNLEVYFVMDFNSSFGPIMVEFAGSETFR